MEKECESNLWTPIQLAEQYVADNILQPDSIRNYRLAAHVFEKNMGRRHIYDINPDCVLKWRTLVLNRAQPTTWNTYRSHLIVIWNFALRNQWVDVNPFSEIRPAPVLKKGKKTVSDDLLAATIDLLHNTEKAPRPAWFWLTAFKLLYFTGMRRRQLTSLRWNDINFKEMTILLTAEGCKTKREWEVPLPNECLKDLLYLRQCTEALNKQAIKANNQVFRIQLFYSRYKGEELSPQQMGGFFKRLSLQLTGRVSSHRLRHTMATQLAKGPNRDLKALQHVLGHSNLSTTLEYVHPDSEQLSRFLNQLRLPQKR